MTLTLHCPEHQEPLVPVVYDKETWYECPEGDYSLGPDEVKELEGEE